MNATVHYPNRCTVPASQPDGYHVLPPLACPPGLPNSSHLPRQKLVANLKTRWPNSKFLLSIGGGGFNLNIWARAATVGLDAFINSIVRTMKETNADGVDSE